MQRRVRMEAKHDSNVAPHHWRYDKESPHVLLVCFATPAAAVARNSCRRRTAPLVRFIVWNDGLLCLRALWAVLVTACGVTEHFRDGKRRPVSFASMQGSSGRLRHG